MKFDDTDIKFENFGKPVLIAEIGVNHNCDMNLAVKLVDKAKEAGADIVKFQAFVAEEEISRYAEKADYQKETTGSSGGQLEMAKSLELSHDQLRYIRNYCREKSIAFLCTAFDEPSLDFLVNDLKVSSIKIASSELTNHPFLERVANTGIGIILSTGASSMEEVEAAVNVVQSATDSELVILHCVSNYPAPVDSLNLSAIDSLHQKFSIPVGYSDHSEGVLAPVVAVSLGACLIEKHFTLDKNSDGPDHRASIEPDELEQIANGINIAWRMLGNGIKVCSESEEKNQLLIRKSIVAATELKGGEVLSLDMLKFKRPGNGIPPFELKKILGRKLVEKKSPDQPILWSDII